MQIKYLCAQRYHCNMHKMDTYVLLLRLLLLLMHANMFSNPFSNTH